MADSPPTSRRRNKRSTPDNDKDDKYWERRKRNNIAAKKSRDNKRQFDSVLRSQVAALTEENEMLRSELTELKRRFGLPEDRCVLSEDEREACVRQTREAERWVVDVDHEVDDDRTSYMPHPQFKHVMTQPPSPLMGRYSGNSRHGNGYSSQSISDLHVLYQESRKGSGVSKMFHSSETKTCYSDDPRAILRTTQVVSKRLNPSTAEYPETPADLSHKKQACVPSTCSDVTERLGRLSETHAEREIDLTVDCDTEIREKLRMLSQQVEHMQKLVR